ncbi:heat shock protein GrpE [Pontibacillus halophilus JSM 076056 = DSM 19796]|uniref:Protein GrpE n=1 Tax=Pontibacillus halophilus JSM 076056 = DSM 19796 TaxID=1385510 RepID=A0A0A5GR01_9BACI|nr:nucleotide exchange factor GrpE [Pontibacillus halophilus]KGX93570.1 heat shock protein GrpE [Pontibacillus halophilus JSM 076056 = DSM 19796]
MEENKQQSEQVNDEVQDDQEVVEPEVEVIDETETVGEATSNSEVEQLQQEKEELQNRLARLQADYDNFRRRTQKEREADRKYKSQDLVNELLPALDNFERALQVDVQDESTKSFKDGIQMVYRQLSDALEKEGVEVIPAEGETFDPQIHQAVMQVEDENYASNVVVAELQKGYRLKDRVIRPSMVKVNQ